MAEQESIFRKQSLDSISSPEQLNDYIRAVSPGVWFTMAAVIVLLAGMCVWGVFGHIDTRITTGAVCADGTLTVFIPERYEAQMTDRMSVTVDGSGYPITAVSRTPVPIDGGQDAYALHTAGLAEGEYGFTAEARTGLPDGAYKVVVTMESIRPVSFLTDRGGQ